MNTKLKIAALVMALIATATVLAACNGSKGTSVTTTAPVSTSASDSTTTAKAVYTLPDPNATTTQASADTGETTAAQTPGTTAASGDVSMSANTTAAVTPAGDNTSSGSYKVGTYVVNTQNDPLSLRLTPEQNADIITTIAKGATVEVLAVSGEWGYVVSGSTGGWVAMKYLKAA